MEYIEGKEPYKRQNIPYHSQRPPIRECSEAQFMRDYCAFCSSQMGRRVTPDSWPDTVLNGIRLDVYNLYREVVQRGGFGCVPLMSDNSSYIIDDMNKIIIVITVTILPAGREQCINFLHLDFTCVRIHL